MIKFLIYAREFLFSRESWFVNKMVKRYCIVNFVLKKISTRVVNVP